MDVYINDIASFLPNEPVSNDEMEQVLGMVNMLPSRSRRIILRNNKITTRYYAIDPQSGEFTHTNAQLTAEAIRRLKPTADFTPADIEFLGCGTSQADQLMPGHGLMVHGELGGSACEIISTSGICIAGVTSLKAAYMSVAQGLTANAVATGSELSSSFMRSRFCGSISSEKAAALEKTPSLSFEADFLRWMLSDGAGAMYLSPQANSKGISLRVDWIDMLSFAHEMEPCMYAGADKQEDGTLKTWRQYENLHDAVDDGIFMVRQDVKLLNDEIIPTSVDRALLPIAKKRNLDPGQVDWFIPHYSSDYFRSRLDERMKMHGLGIPEERWFSNLTTKGNTGSASIYIILEELFKSGKLKKGDRLLCFVPESGRFSISYMHFTVV
jgi:3-oxoacyl-[acyl-carrier-protein] synthase-3